MGHTILLIEDDPPSARLAEVILQAEGHRVTVAANGLQGLNIARENPPDLILLDLMLPGVDGFEVLNRLRRDPRTANVRVVVVSAKGQAEDRQTAAKLGVDGYLTKPYKKNELLEIVKPLLAERPERTTEPGRCLLLIGPRGDEAASVTVGVGRALTAQGRKVTVVDLRPFSVLHSLLLDVAPPTAPVSLSSPDTLGQLPKWMTQHPSGLRVLNNLEGSGEAGQITPQDVRALLDTLLRGGGVTLLDLPLYPADVLQQAAGLSERIILVVQDDAASLTAARSALMLMGRVGIDEARTGIVAIGAPAEERLAELQREVLGTIPAEARPDAPAFEALADRLRGSQ